MNKGRAGVRTETECAFRHARNASLSHIPYRMPAELSHVRHILTGTDVWPYGMSGHGDQH
ncbi:MAG: hypothetical protein IOMNBAOH_00702 [Rhodocyclaceae bacterium]|nr:hypothetical protein [Rhodocyclaceae bacterium]